MRKGDWFLPCFYNAPLRRGRIRWHELAHCQESSQATGSCNLQTWEAREEQVREGMGEDHTHIPVTPLPPYQWNRHIDHLKSFPCVPFSVCVVAFLLLMLEREQPGVEMPLCPWQEEGPGKSSPVPSTPQSTEETVIVHLNPWEVCIGSYEDSCPRSSVIMQITKSGVQLRTESWWQ